VRPFCILCYTRSLALTLSVQFTAPRDASALDTYQDVPGRASGSEAPQTVLDHLGYPSSGNRGRRDRLQLEGRAYCAQSRRQRIPPADAATRQEYFVRASNY
jgi:hypothetical protein